ncbi:interferon-induced protein 44-like [Leuresthes tenuis]|uniref:interferon-induced protein 44-like n=1 Tax=Leuresthes tenuis TaxID=355514 RepID=UPI003B502241
MCQTMQANFFLSLDEPDGLMKLSESSVWRRNFGSQNSDPLTCHLPASTLLLCLPGEESQADYGTRFISSSTSSSTSTCTNNREVLKTVKGYKPPTEGQLLRILLHGAVGAGKSSLVNSVQSVMRGRIYRQALADNTSGDSFTKEYKTYRIKKDDGSYYPFVCNDIMGLSKHGGVLVEDIKLALKGHVKDGYKFNPVSQLSEGDRHYNESPTSNDRVHVLVCVIPADTLSLMDDKVVEKFRSIRAEASNLKIPQLAFLTKIDLAFPEVKDVKNAYRSRNVKAKMQKFSEDVGIPMNCIFPVRNYSEETEMNDDIDSLILNAMKHILQCGHDFLDFTQNEPDSS